MADNYLTLKDMAARAGTDDLVGLIENVVNVAPEMDMVQGRMIPGISYLARVRSAIAANAGFRAINSGVALSASAYDQKRFNCFPFDVQMRVDEATIIAGEAEGDSMGKILSEEAGGAMRARAIALGKQFYLGTTNDTKGCPGMLDFLKSARLMPDSRTGHGIDQIMDANSSATGTNLEFVWMLHLSPQGVHWLFGGNRGLTLSPWIRQQVTPADASSTKNMSWCSNIFGYIGTSCANYHAVGAICNIDATTTINTTPLTDLLVTQLWAKFPIGLKPNVCFASQNAIASLQVSRTTVLYANAERAGQTNSGAAAASAPWPTALPTAGGIPIIPTDSITRGAKFTPTSLTTGT